MELILCVWTIIFVFVAMILILDDRNLCLTKRTANQRIQPAVMNCLNTLQSL